MTLSFKVDPGLKEALQKLADADYRGLSNYIVRVLIKHLEEKGIDYKEKPSKPQK